MVWWLLAPIGVAVGKLIYDAVTEDSSSSSNYEEQKRKAEEQAQREQKEKEKAERKCSAFFMISYQPTIYQALKQAESGRLHLFNS